MYGGRIEHVTDSPVDLARRAQLKYPAFDADVHPEILFRGVVMGLPAHVLADLIGIPLRMLLEWIEHEPELRTAAMRAARADSDVTASLYYAAIGIDPDTRSRTKKGPDVRACIAWLKHRQDWREEPAKGRNVLDEMSIAQAQQLMTDLEKKLSTNTFAAEPVRGGDNLPPVVEVEPETDAGF